MDEEEYKEKYANLRILKSIQEYLKPNNGAPTAVYPIRVPDDMLYQVLKHQGPEKADNLIHQIFNIGLTLWSENLFNDIFGTQQSLEEFIDLVKKRTKKQNP